jgi:2-polyprenyl-3-methyl-5-hydroxy-6-metoxy-1,4-benzoquinol methylase
MQDLRLNREVEHGRFLADRGAGDVWNWETPAGRLRWRRRVGMLTSLLEPGMAVLEVGCGIGYFTKEILKVGVGLTAIDISPELVVIAKREIPPGGKLSLSIQNAYDLGFQGSRFDAVVGSSVLHHLDVERALRECFRVLKPGGTIGFTEPNMLNPQIALQKNIPFLKKKLGDSPDETAFFPWEMKRYLKSSGFTDIQVQCFDFLHPAIPGSWLPLLQPIASGLEKIPFVSDIAGSLWIRAKKP